MTGLEKITTQIIDEAAAAAKKTKNAAQAEADKILASAKEEYEAAAAQLKAEAEAQKAAIEAQASSGAALKVRQAALAAKQQIIAAVIRDAKESLFALDDNAYFALLGKMVEKYAPEKSGKLLLSAKDLARMPADFAEAAKKRGLTVSDETRAIDGGFVLDYDGIEENCSFEALFYASQEALQDKVQEFLFR